MMAAIEAAHRKAQAELDTWRNLAMEGVREGNEVHVKRRHENITLLDQQQKEIDNILASSHSLLFSPDHTFLKVRIKMEKDRLFELPLWIHYVW